MSRASMTLWNRSTRQFKLPRAKGAHPRAIVDGSRFATNDGKIREVRVRLRYPLLAAALALGSTEGCGYLGLDPLVDENVSVTTGGSGGDGDGDGDGDLPSGGLQEGIGGSLPPGGGGFSFGGFGGGGGLGGRGGYEPPDAPCTYACPDPFLLYQDFEAGLPLLGIKADEGAAVVLTTEIVHGHDYALSATQGEAGTDAQITERIRRVVGAHIYSRMWLFIPEGAINDWLKVLAFNGIVLEGLDVNLTSSGAAEIYSHMTGQKAVSPGAVVPENEWFCLRTTTFVDNVNGSVELSINDHTVAYVQNWDTLPGAEIDNIVYGIGETGPEQTDATIYVDDILASTEPVPCSL